MRDWNLRKLVAGYFSQVACVLGLTMIANDASMAQQIDLASTNLPRWNAGTSETPSFTLNSPLGANVGEQEQEAVGSGLIQPVPVRPSSTEPIEVLPLQVPNISTDGIGTGAKPTDSTVGRLPPPRPLPTGIDRSIEGAHHHRYWEPSGICHKPLYFQEVMLERHGHERFPCLQPMISGARFFGTLPLMPYMMTLHRPSEDLYNLGYYRPGSVAPFLRERPPYDARAIGTQTVITGAAFGLLPL